MPELPEVEVLKLSLEPRLVGRRVERVRVTHTHLRRRVSRRDLERRVVGRRVLALRRRAKYLLADLSGDQTLVVHLGMSGRLLLVDTESPPLDHEHVTFELDDGRRLAFRDPRRFGLVQALSTPRLERHRLFRDLGVEPLAQGFDGERLRHLARGRRGPVKNFLMNGRLVVGVGNIYACEALHRARVHPRRSVARIAAARWMGIAEAMRAVLGRAIEEGGTTLNDFRDGDGNEGYFQVSLEVYGREGEACRRCGRPIRRVLMAGRGTFYCAGCQR